MDASDPGRFTDGMTTQEETAFACFTTVVDYIKPPTVTTGKIVVVDRSASMGQNMPVFYALQAFFSPGTAAHALKCGGGTEIRKCVREIMNDPSIQGRTVEMVLFTDGDENGLDATAQAEMVQALRDAGVTISLVYTGPEDLLQTNTLVQTFAKQKDVLCMHLPPNAPAASARAAGEVLNKRTKTHRNVGGVLLTACDGVVKLDEANLYEVVEDMSTQDVQTLYASVQALELDVPATGLRKEQVVTLVDDCFAMSTDNPGADHKTVRTLVMLFMASGIGFPTVFTAKRGHFANVPGGRSTLRAVNVLLSKVRSTKPKLLMSLPSPAEPQTLVVRYRDFRFDAKVAKGSASYKVLMLPQMAQTILDDATLCTPVGDIVKSAKRKTAAEGEGGGKRARP